MEGEQFRRTSTSDEDEKQLEAVSSFFIRSKHRLLAYAYPR